VSLIVLSLAPSRRKARRFNYETEVDARCCFLSSNPLIPKAKENYSRSIAILSRAKPLHNGLLRAREYCDYYRAGRCEAVGK
jgi:hypothetical protein